MQNKTTKNITILSRNITNTENEFKSIILECCKEILPEIVNSSTEYPNLIKELKIDDKKQFDLLICFENKIEGIYLNLKDLVLTTDRDLYSIGILKELTNVFEIKKSEQPLKRIDDYFNEIKLLKKNLQLLTLKLDGKNEIQFPKLVETNEINRYKTNCLKIRKYYKISLFVNYSIGIHVLFFILYQVLLILFSEHTAQAFLNLEIAILVSICAFFYFIFRSDKIIPRCHDEKTNRSIR